MKEEKICIKSEIDLHDVRRFLENCKGYVVGKLAFDKYLNKDEVFKILSKDLLMLLERERQVIKLALMINSKMSGLIIVRESKWDSEHFGIKIGKAIFLYFSPLCGLNYRLLLLQKLRTVLASENYDLLLVRTPLTEMLTVSALEKQAAILTDVLVTFYKDLSFNGSKLKSYSVSFSKIRVEEASKQDRDRLSRIAEDIFEFDHFHADPFLSRRKSDKLYAKWIINSLYGSADKVLVAKKGKDLLGFITCKINRLNQRSAYGIIDLIGVAKENRRLGIGTYLISEALQWFHKKASSIYVGTQAGNIAAMRLYSKLRFKPVYSEATLHLWIS